MFPNFTESATEAKSSEDTGCKSVISLEEKLPPVPKEEFEVPPPEITSVLLFDALPEGAPSEEEYELAEMLSVDAFSDPVEGVNRESRPAEREVAPAEFVLFPATEEI